MLTQPQEHRTIGNTMPNSFPGLLGVCQVILWLAIIGLESTSVYYDPGRGTVYAGFWCSSIFFVTWVAMFGHGKWWGSIDTRFHLFLQSLVCCSKSAGCRIYLIVQNVINLVFAIILTSWTSRFVSDPCLCVGALCTVPNWHSLYNKNNNNNNFRDMDEPFLCTYVTYKKLPALKGLLACAILMSISSAIFLIGNLVVLIKVKNSSGSPAPSASTHYQRQPDVVEFGGQSQYHANRLFHTPPDYYQPAYGQPYPQTDTRYPSAPFAHEVYPSKYWLTDTALIIWVKIFCNCERIEK